MAFLTLLLKRLPWILLVLALIWIFISQSGIKVIPESTETQHSIVLERIEDLGKLELVKYNFQEITELKKISAELDFKYFKLKNGPDSKAILISKGEAAGCIDLTKITKRDIFTENDTLFIRLPNPELCYFKLDLQQSQIYDLKLGYLSQEDKMKFIEELYLKAEDELRKAAIQSGILDRTLDNAETILKPLFIDIAEKEVQFVYQPSPSKIDIR